MNPAGVFFDLYGTLLVAADPDAAWGAWGRSFLSMLARHGHALPVNARRQLSERFMDPPAPTRLENGFTLYEQRVHEFLCEAGVVASVACVREVAIASAQAWHEHYAPDPEADGVLARLRSGGCRLALVSNFDHPPLLRARLESAGLAVAFDVIVVSAEIGVEKPDPAAFRPALEATGLEPARVVHVGDTAADVHGAQAAGVRPVYLCRTATPDPAIANDVIRIRSLCELEDLLSGGDPG
jgi:HAD superfamily hydrolase (TIGR01509 family)